MTARVLVLAAGVLAMGSHSRSAAAATFTIGTLAPRNSSWVRLLRRAAVEIRRRTKGAVKLRLVPDGELGDERRMVELMSSGEIQGAGVTAVGLGLIQPALLVQHLPLLIRNHEELDCVREKMDARFDALMAEKGYVVLGYSDVGFVHVFTRKPVTSQEEMHDIRVWAWADDPIGRKMMALAGLTQVPLPVPEVRRALKRGDVDAFYASPYAAIALGWFPFVKYVYGTRLAMAMGAIVVTKSAWGTLDKRQQTIVASVVEKWARRLARRIRRDNRRAIQTLRKHGVRLVGFTSGEHSMFLSISEKVREHFVGKLYGRELLDEVMTTVRRCRKERAAAGRLRP